MRIKLTKFILVLALGVVISLPSMASAWMSGRFYEGYEAFDKIEIFMQDGTSLTDPAMVNLSSADWQSVLVNSTYTLITGPETTYLENNFQLPDPDSVARTFDYLVYDKGQLLYGQIITLGGGHVDLPVWAGADGVTGSNGIAYDRTDPPPPVPLPPSVLLMGTGLLGLGLLPWRKKTEV